MLNFVEHCPLFKRLKPDDVISCFASSRNADVIVKRVYTKAVEGGDASNFQMAGKSVSEQTSNSAGIK